MSGELKKLIIDSYKDPKFNGAPADSFTAMFNPSTYSVKYEVEYEEDQGKGTSALPQKFKQSKPIDFAIDIILDGTGASGEKIDVTKKLGEFLKAAYEFDGDIHRPRYLKIVWGTLLVNCVFKSANVKYNLFKSDGTPLRATISATFHGSIAEEKRVAEEKKESPDLAKYHTVVEGETLPLLSFRYYGDAKHYVDVAKINALNDFCALKAGDVLLFPPLSKTSNERKAA